VTNYFVTSGCKIEDEVTAVEGAYAVCTVKYHNSFLSMDFLSSLLKKMLPDSDLAKKVFLRPNKDGSHSYICTCTVFDRCCLDKF